MRIGPFVLSRQSVQAAAVAPPPRPKGASGTVNLSGFLQPTEYNPSLLGLNGLKTIDQMLRSDGAVQEAIEHIVSPIKNASWAIKPCSDEPEALEHAAFIECAYHKHLAKPWLESLDEQLDYLWFGFAVFEQSFQVVEESLYYTDPETGERVDLPARQFVTLDDFEARLQHTIYKWNTQGSKLVSIIQHAAKDGVWGDWEIPAENLLVFSNKKRGDEWTGRSMLRSAYKHWFAKDLIEKQEMVALERWGVGIPVGYPPDSSDTEAIERVEQILVDLRGGEHSYIASPGPKQTTAMPGYVWEIIGPSGTPPNFNDAINRHRGDIKAAVLARFAELGHSSVGARATGDIQAVVWFSALHAIASYICQSHRAVIKRLIDFNYPGVNEYPEMVATDIEVRNLVEYATAISQLVSSTAVTTTPGTEAAIRKAVDLPQKETPEELEPDPTDPGEAGEPTEPENQPGDPQFAQPPGQNHPPSGYQP